MLIIAIIANDELIELGMFPDFLTAQEIYGEQTELLGFKSREEFNEFDQTVAQIREFKHAMELAADCAADWYTQSIQAYK